jgi:hypothetical protein
LLTSQDGFIRTFGDQVSILNYLQAVSTELKIARKLLKRRVLFNSGFTKSNSRPLSGGVSGARNRRPFPCLLIRIEMDSAS